MLTINRERFLGMMRDQAKIGATPEDGLSRPSLSEADMQIREWFKQQVQANDLIYREDGAANQSAIYESADPATQTLLTGSHFDSVPDGGRFDGALGVLAAFEAQLTLKDAGIDLPFHLEVINFTDEEGTLVGLFGSSAITGQLSAASLQQPRGGRERLEAGMARAGISDSSILSAIRPAADFCGYIEVHIEQGKRLEKAGLTVGVVTSIVGIRSLWIIFKGEAAHAGAKPMDERRDAFVGAIDFAQQARAHIMTDFHPGVMNVGLVTLEPAAFNIVPATAMLGVEFRHGDETQLDAMESALLDLAQSAADAHGLGLEITRMHNVKAAPMADEMVAAVEQAATALDLGHTRLLSFAGHDAQSLATVTDSVMFFVPSRDGISHHPAEFTSDEDCVHAANVMLHTILQRAQR